MLRSRGERRVGVGVSLVLSLCALVIEFLVGNAVLAAPTKIVGGLGVHFVEKDETLLDIARTNRLGILELMAANPGMDPWIPREGGVVILPLMRILPDAPESGIVLNLAERRLYLFRGESKKVQSWPVGIGRLGFTTPLGQTHIARKAKNPTWYPTQEARAENPELPAAVPPGPDNPMGRYALYLGWPQYAIHGTNRPWGIGRCISRGCIRLYPEDIENLYEQVEVGTEVTVVDQMAKLAWHQGQLHLEVHPSRMQLDQLEKIGGFPFEPIEGLLDLIKEAAGDKAKSLDLRAIARAERQRRGVPLVVAW